MISQNLKSFAAALVLLFVLAVPFALAQWQVNPQVNTGIYAGPGPTSVRYAGQYSGSRNTVFNISSNSADTRQGFANTGAYAPNGVLNGGAPGDQAYRIIPESAVASPTPTVRYSATPSRAMINADAGSQVGGQVGGGPINTQVSGAINARAY